MRRAFATGSADLQWNAPSSPAYCATQPSLWGTVASRATFPNYGSGRADPTRCLRKPRSGQQTVSPSLSLRPSPDQTSGAAYHVGGVESLGSLLAFELDRIAFVQRLVSILLDRGEVHEHILTSGTLDKSVSLRSVEPLDHAIFLQENSLSTSIDHRQHFRDTPGSR